MKMGTSSSAGESLARVMIHYGLVGDISSSKMKVICPFHGDKNPSMSVDFDTGFWYCFGCGLSGDAQKFVKLIENQKNGLNDLEALKVYVNITKGAAKNDHIYLPKPTRRNSRHLYNVAYDYYHGLRKVSWMSPEGFEEIESLEYMRKRGFTAKALAKTGAKVTYNDNYQLIFPMRDNGKFKGWVCRTTNPDIEKRRKYLYNKGFSRATTLVGDYGKKKFSGIKSKYVIVVEGYMDRLKFLQFGVNNVVAILGWKMSSEQMEKLREAGIEVVVSALDNDECGKKGTAWLKKNFNVVRFSYLKGFKDPGDMDKKSFDKMFGRTKQKLRKVFKKGN